MSEKSLKERYETEFIPFLMDSIGDADKYQELWDKVFKKRSLTLGSFYDYNEYKDIDSYLITDHAKEIGHKGGKKIANIDVLFAEWNVKGEESFKKELKRIIEKGKTWNYDDDETSAIEDQEKNKEIESVAAYTPNTTITGNKPDTVLLQSLEELRNHLISYPETSLPKRPYTIPTVLPPKLLLVNKSTASLVKRTSYEFMLDFNNDYLKDCFDKNAPTNINNITDRFEEWETKYGIPVIFSKLYTIFWNLLLIAMDDDLYNQYLSEAINLAHLLSIDENLLQDLCHGVGYVLAGKKLDQDCDLQCKTAECRTFFLHK